MFKTPFSKDKNVSKYYLLKKRLSFTTHTFLLKFIARITDDVSKLIVRIDLSLIVIHLKTVESYPVILDNTKNMYFTLKSILFQKTFVCNNNCGIVTHKVLNLKRNNLNLRK